MVSLIGWFNVSLLVILTAPYWLTRLNRATLKSKDSRFLSLLKLLRAIHKPLGVTVLILAPIHGYLALGGFRLHTGTLLITMFFLTASAGGAFYKTKKKAFFKIHKTLAFMTSMALLLHLLAPGALSQFF
jgi:hypothetical protein